MNAGAFPGYGERQAAHPVARPAINNNTLHREEGIRTMSIDRQQAQRYARHLILPEVGAGGQMRIMKARVLLVGAGGLGCPVGLYLGAAGIGTIGIVDDDLVELSNLQRQIAHGVSTLGTPKVSSLGDSIKEINPDVEVIEHRQRLTRDNVLTVLSEYDIVVDGTDNFTARYLVNDACVRLGKPLVSGAILRFEGQVTTVLPGEGHCYRCLYESPPPKEFAPSCAEAGVLGVLTGVVGSLQATEVLKLVLKKGQPLSNRVLVYDALKTEFRTLPVRRDPQCSACGADHTDTLGLLLEEEEGTVCQLAS